jgi:hypothetical protein
MIIYRLHEELEILMSHLFNRRALFLAPLAVLRVLVGGRCWTRSSTPSKGFDQAMLNLYIAT